MNNASETIPGYAYGAEAVAKSWISLQELEQLKISVGFTAEDERYLRLAGKVLGDQTKQIVEHWRSGIIAGIPHLARHSRSPEGNPLPNYLAASNQRFQQWILDTCLRPYDQVWLDYQQEIALRHTRGYIFPRHSQITIGIASRIHPRNIIRKGQSPTRTS